MKKFKQVPHFRTSKRGKRFKAGRGTVKWKRKNYGMAVQVSGEGDPYWKNTARRLLSKKFPGEDLQVEVGKTFSDYPYISTPIKITSKFSKDAGSILSRGSRHHLVISSEEG